MKKLRHPVAALILFSVLITLCINIYTGLEENYEIEKGDIHTVENITTGNIADQFKAMNLIQGINGISNAIMKISAPGNLLDLLGGLAAAGLGTLKTVIGIITIPYEIVHVIITFYAGEVPGIIGGLIAMIVVYAGFIMLSAYLRHDV